MTVLELPFPISVNAMFSDGKTQRIKSQRYADWIVEAGWELKRQRPAPVKGRVSIHYEFQDGIDGRKRDAFNFEKGVTDLLVTHGIIEADDNTILRKGSVEWSNEVKGVRVTIKPETQTESANVGAGR